MSTPRWLSALLLAALILSSVPAAVSAAPAAATVLQEPAAAGSTSYLLIVTPPKVSIPASTSALQVAGHLNIEHARYYNSIQAQLAALQQQGAIGGFTAEPAAYAFVVRGVSPAAVSDLAAFGQLQQAGDLSAAAVDGLSAAYRESLGAAIAAAARPQLTAAPPPAAASLAARSVKMAAMQAAGVSATSAMFAQNGVLQNFRIQLNSNMVSGQIAPGTVVTATLKTAAGVIKGTAHDISNGGVTVYLEDTYGNPVFVAANDILELQLPALVTIPVVDLRASIDAAAQMATGFAPANVTNTNNSSYPWLYYSIAQSGYITTTPSGTFAVSTTELLPGRTWDLRFANAESQETFVSGEIPILVLRGDYDNSSGDYDQDDAYVSGAVVDANALLTVTLTRAGSPTIVNYTRSDAESSFGLHLYDQYFNRVVILAGDTVQVTGGGVTLSATVPTFDVVSDPTADTVSGTTNATVVTDTINLTQTLAIFPKGTSDFFYDYPNFAFGKLALAPGGSFSVGNNFYQWADPAQAPAELDWQAGEQGHLRYVDANGNVIYGGFVARAVEPVLALRGDTGYTDNSVVTGLTDASAQGTVTLLGADNAVKARNFVDSQPSFATTFYDVYGNPLPIADGDSVVSTFAGRTTSVTTPVFAFAVDPAADLVTGRITGALVTTTTADAPQSLAVFPAVGSSANPVYVQPDADGNFRADFSSIADLLPGSQGYVKYLDAKQNTVYARWQAPFDKPVLSLRGYNEYDDENFVYITLPHFVPQSPCTSTIFVTVKAQDNTVRWQRTMAACETTLAIQLTNGLGSSLDLNPGDTVQATFEGNTVTAVVPVFATVSDPKTSTVSGTTNAVVTAASPGLTQTLAVWPTVREDYLPGKFVLASGGVFSATNPFYPSADPSGSPLDLAWQPGDQGHLRYIDADGNQIYATFGAVTAQPVLHVHKGSNSVDGMAPVSSGPVTVTVKSGAAVKGVGVTNTGLGGMFGMEIFDGRGNPIRIAEGDVIEFTPPLTTVVVPPLTAVVDVENDRISGKGPANARLNLRLDGMIKYYEGMTIATDKDGNYVLDLRGLIDIQPGMWGHLQYRNPDGQTIYIEQPAGASLEGGLNTSRVWGQAPAGDTQVQVTVQRAGSVIGMDTLVADEDGEYVAFLIDAAGRPVIQQPGDVITATFGSGGARSLTLAPLQMSVDLATNTLRGVGPAASRLGVWADTYPDYLDTTVLTDGNGQWSLALDTWLLGIEAGDYTDVVYTTNAIDYTWLGAVAPVFWVRSSDAYDDNSVEEGNIVNNLVTGYAAADTPVMVTLKRNGGVLAFRAVEPDDWGYYIVYLRDRNGLTANILPGDVVEVQTVASPPVSVTVPILTAVVDQFARVITGVGPANAALGLYLDYGGSLTVHTGPDGTFTVTFPNIGITSVGSGAVVLTYREPQGNWIKARTGQPVVAPAHLEVRWDTNFTDLFYGSYLAHAVSGSAGAALAQVQLSLHRSGLVIASGAVMSGQDGYFSAALRDSDGEPVDILAGDLIEMVAGEVTRSLTVPELTVHANLQSQTLYGTGPANAPLMVEGADCGLRPRAYGYDEYVVDPVGNWVLPCPGLDHFDSGWLAVQDLEGNRTYLNWSVPSVEVLLGGNVVGGVLTSETEAHVQLWRLNTLVTETVVTASADNGWFLAQFLGSGGSPFIIMPNDTVVVVYGDQSITVPVVPLSASIDSATDQVTGSGPASQALDVMVLAGGPTGGRHVTTDGDGAYVADFAGVLDLQGGDYVGVAHMNADGNVVYLLHAAPLVRINLGSDIVDGFATPNAIASVVLKRGGSAIAATKAPTDMYGAFSAFFRDAQGNVINLVAGDVVEVTASPTVAASAVDLTVVVDPTRDQISGSAPAGVSVLVTAYRCAAGGCAEYSATAIAGPDGSYSLDLAGIFDLDLTSYAFAQVLTGQGSMTSFTSTPAAVPQLAELEGSLQAQGATFLASSFGAANSGNLTPPMAVSVVGAGKLIFIATGGTLVVTAPDGAVMRSQSGYLMVANPLSGQWLVQVLIGAGEAAGHGTQYAVAVGRGLYTVYMPVVKLRTTK